MPRLIPRLLKSLENASLRQKEHKPLIQPPQRPPKKVSLRKPVPPVPSVLYDGQTKSILLEDGNLVANRRRFRQHKSLPPQIRLHRNVKRKANDPEEEELYDRPRRMTAQERVWHADPYLRMLVSPVRECRFTSVHLPTDFLIRVAALRLPTPRGARPAQIVVPDGLQHPRFKNRRSMIGYYMVCRKEVLGQAIERHVYQRLSTNVTLHSRLEEQIGHLLRVRVLQELEILADRLQCRPFHADDAPLLRRLTRAEWKAVRETGVIPYKNAVALLVVPPLNKNPTTKKRPEPSSSPLPIPEDEKPANLARPLPPLSVLHPTSVPESPTEAELDDENLAGLEKLLPKSQVPLYNGVSLFPSRAQRAALHAGLNRLLFVERRARWRLHGRPDPASPSEESVGAVQKDKWARGDQKASHAYLLCSDAKTLLRADAVPLAIALWRVRMWEGASWAGSAPDAGGWMVKEAEIMPYRTAAAAAEQDF